MKPQSMIDNGQRPETAALFGARDEWRRGSKVVASAHIGMATGAGLYLYLSSLFLVPLTEQFGWSRGDAASSGALGLLGALTAPYIGKLADRFGTKPVVVVCTVLMAMAFTLMSQISGSLAQFILFSALFGLVAPGCSGFAYSKAVASWFSKGRGQALGVMSAGSSIGVLLFAPIVAWAIDDYGFMWGYLVLAGLPIIIGLPAVVYGLNDNNNSSYERERAQSALIDNKLLAPETSETARVEQHSVGKVIASPAFIVLAFAVFALNAPGAGVLTQLDPILEQNGINSPGFAISMFAAAVLVGRIGIGWLFDRLDARYVAAFFVVVGGIGCLMLMANITLWLTFLAVILLGLLQGMETDVIGYFVGRHFSQDQFGVLSGTLFAISMLGTGVGIIGFGQLYDATQSYDMALASAAGFLAVSMIAFLRMPKHSRWA